MDDDVATTVRIGSTDADVSGNDIGVACASALKLEDATS